MIFTLNTISKVFALVSFILSMLCLFAGSQNSVLQNASVMMVSIHQLVAFSIKPITNVGFFL